MLAWGCDGRILMVKQGPVLMCRKDIDSTSDRKDAEWEGAKDCEWAGDPQQVCWSLRGECQKSLQGML